MPAGSRKRTSARPRSLSLRRGCARFVQRGGFANPLPTALGLISVRAATGALTPVTRVVRWGSVTGLDCGFELRMVLRGASSAITLSLATFAHPARILALDRNGGVVMSLSMHPSPRVVQSIHLTGRGIREVVVLPPADETLLVEMCTRSPARVKPPRQRTS